MEHTTLAESLSMLILAPDQAWIRLAVAAAGGGLACSLAAMLLLEAAVRIWSGRRYPVRCRRCGDTYPAAWSPDHFDLCADCARPSPSPSPTPARWPSARTSPPTDWYHDEP